MDIWTSFVDLLIAGLFAFSNIYGGNMGLAVITLSLVVRLALLPLSLKLAHRSLTRQLLLKKLQPKLEQFKARHRNNPGRLAKETMKLYERHGVHPIDGRGILGGLLQAPIFLGLFSAIRRGLGTGGRFLWITDISKPDFPLTLLVAALTFLAAIITPNLPEQSRTFMALVSTILTVAFLWRFAAGLGLYWATSNVVSILQAAILRRQTRSLFQV